MGRANITLAANAGAGNGSAAFWHGGKGYMTGEGTWGGGNIKLQFKTLNSTTWIDVTSVSLTANGGIAFELPPGEIRGVITTSSAVYAYAHPM